MFRPTTLVSLLGLLLLCTALTAQVGYAKPKPKPRTTTVAPDYEEDEVDDPETPKCEGRMIPGIEKMARGVDITELTLFSTDQQRRNGFRKTVIEFTCKKGEKWVHPSVELDTEYAKPDQISGINTNSAGDMKAQVELTSESENFKVNQLIKVGLEYKPLKVGFKVSKKDEDEEEDDEDDGEDSEDDESGGGGSSGGGLFGSFSASASLKRTEENLYRENQSVAETASTVSSLFVDFKSAHFLPLSEDFLYYLNELVEPYEKTPRLYDDFVDTFGTHYFETGILGGYLYQRTLLTERYSKASTEQEIKANLKAAFYGVTGSVGGEDIRKTTTQSYRENSDTTFAFFGGLPVAIDPNEPPGKFLEAWVPTVNRDPWLFGGQLKPIEKLIKDEAIRKEVKKAIRLKKARAFLGEIKRLINLFRYQLEREEAESLRDITKKLTNKKQASRNVAQAVKDLTKIKRALQEFRKRGKLAWF